MTLSFPNPSRSFDGSRNRVCFWGYDRAIEISFFAEESAMLKLCPELEPVEAGFLSAFDGARTKIRRAAMKVYVRGAGRASGYSLIADDF
jgi:hypothetical protein